MGDKKGLPSLPSLPAKQEKKDWLEYLAMPYEPSQVKEAAQKELENKDPKKSFTTTNSSVITKALTLKEFHHGLLMVWGLKDEYQTFAVQLSRNYQKEYKCETAGKKSLAELAAQNYCRILEAQRRINSYLELGNITDMGVKYLAVMSKELDRAQRHYLTSMQALEMGLQPPLNLSIRTQTANIAGQQAIQQVGEQTNVKG